MKLRNFDIGRQQESLLNEEHYNIFKILEPYLKNGSPNSPSSGPISEPGTINEIIDGAVWIDRSNDPTDSDLKYFSNGEWNLFFKNRFKITQDIISSDEPNEPIEGQLWIDERGVLNYYYRGVWKPIKAVPDNLFEDANLQGFEDFIIIEALTASEKTIIDNFTSWLLAEVPITKWQSNTKYTINQGCIKDLDIYVCKKEHTSNNNNSPDNREYWTKVQKLYQYIIPNSREDKFFLDGYFVHEQCLLKENTEHTHDKSCQGYKTDTNISISFPIELVDGKTANGVHVNPKRLHKVTKKFIMIDKNNPIIEVPEENTEFYGFHGGVGKLLIKTDNSNTTEYTSVVSNNIDCIKLTNRIANIYDFVYTIHYEFLDTKIKTLGTVTKKRQKLNDNNYIWIGPANPDKLCVFAQGLYYAEDKDNIQPTWTYNPETEYLYLSEKLQDYENLVKTFDFSVIQFPERYEGVITDNFEVVNGKEMFRINLPDGYPTSENFIVFTSGLELDVVAGEVIRHSTNRRVLYIPSITRDMYLNSSKIFYCVVGCKGTFDGKQLDMYRGTTRAVYNRQYGVHIPIYTDSRYPVENGLLLKANEAPLLFVDGVLVFQKEIERGNDYITIYGLQEGQEVLLIADNKDETLIDNELSDSLIFEDTVSYATIPTPQSDATIVYVENSILSDASAVYTSKKPVDKGYHGEIRYHINYDADTWYRYDAIKDKWIEISREEKYIDPISNEEVLLIDVLDKNSRGYTHTKKSISFLQNLNEEVCTYYAYKFSDSIEKPLLMGYCYPNNKDGVNIKATENINNPQPFKTSGRHVYVPGRNELSIYLNGIRQELNSPNDINFSNSKNREGELGKYDEFVLAIDNNTKQGEAIKSEEGYYVYSLKKWNEESSVVSNRELSASEIQRYENEGWIIELISEPNRNIVFYVIEPCETGEYKACTRKILTYKDALASEGAYVNNTYNTDEFLLTRGNIRVFINGFRQPYGNYTTLESLETDDPYRLAYKILDQRTIQIEDPIIGGMGGNEGTLNNPLFSIGEIKQPDGTYKKSYYEVIDKIIIESRTDTKLREITIPIKDNSGEFSELDGLPAEIFNTKDRLMIYINGMAYGKEYKIEDNKIKLLNSEIKNLLGISKKDIITFEWR